MGSATDASASATETSSTEAASTGSVGSTGASSAESTTGEGASTGSSMGGCGVDPGISGPVVGTIVAQDLERQYMLVVPADYDSDRAYPLVFMWHGRGGNGEGFRQYSGVEDVAGGEAIFVYPDGLPVESMGNQTGWEMGATDRDVALFDALYVELTSNLCIDPERVFSAGHSFGGFFTNALGCVRGDVLRAIAPVASGGPAGACTGQVAAWIAHGEGDAVVDEFLGEMSRRHWRDANSCDMQTEPVDPTPCETHLGCDEGYPVTWCLHSEGTDGNSAHAWPSFGGSAIWAFFSES